MAKEILRDMNFDHLEIEIERSSHESKSGKDAQLTIETTKTRLIIKPISE